MQRASVRQRERERRKARKPPFPCPFLLQISLKMMCVRRLVLLYLFFASSSSFLFIYAFARLFRESLVDVAMAILANMRAFAYLSLETECSLNVKCEKEMELFHFSVFVTPIDFKHPNQSLSNRWLNAEPQWKELKPNKGRIEMISCY